MKYHLTINGTGPTTAEATDKFYKFENLKLYTLYHITVATENEKEGGKHGGGTGTAAPIDCKTDPKGKNGLNLSLQSNR